MPQLLVRDVDPAVVQRLKARAERHGRSLEAELRLILQEAAARDMGDANAVLERVREMLSGREFSDSAELIREDRDR
jgi:antitoxin FitA